VCKSVLPITITQLFVSRKPFNDGILVPFPIIAGRILIELSRLDGLALQEGFKHWPEMIRFFWTVHSLPFHGWLIEWRPYNQ